MFLRGKRTIRGCNGKWSKSRPRRSARFPVARLQSNDRERIRAANYRALPARLPEICASEDRSASANPLHFDVPILPFQKVTRRKLLDAAHERMRAGDIIQREVIMEPG